MMPVLSSSVRVEAIPLHEIHEAGLPEHPELPDWQRMLVLRSQPFQNLIPRRQP